MASKHTFLICDICGMMVEVIGEAAGIAECCGEPMRELVPGTVDASLEKHVPVAKREGGKLSVDVGAAAHPMEKDHYIEWIQICQGGDVQRKKLSPGDAPHAEFCVGDGPVQVYAYCNKHGLWECKC